jgi:hypothetical protein
MTGQRFFCSKISRTASGEIDQNNGGHECRKGALANFAEEVAGVNEVGQSIAARGFG